MTNEQIGEVVMAIGKKPLECDNGILGWHDSVYKERYDLLQLLTDITFNGYEFRVKPDKPPQPTPTQIPGYKVVDFRPPLKGEKFWSKRRYENGAISNCADENDPPNEPRYILAKIAPEKREVKYPVQVLGEMYIIHRQGQTRNITKLPGMVGFKWFVFQKDGEDQEHNTRPTRLTRDGTEVAKFAVFQETT